jgi:hypothetical protein
MPSGSVRHVRDHWRRILRNVLIATAQAVPFAAGMGVVRSWQREVPGLNWDDQRLMASLVLGAVAIYSLATQLIRPRRWSELDAKYDETLIVRVFRKLRSSGS